MIKVGDRVKFLNDVGGGVVTGFINKKTVNVEGEDGFEIPYPIHELVNISAPENHESISAEAEQEEKESTQEQIFVEAKGEIINGKDDPDFYFAMVPANSKNPVNAEIELFLINNSNFRLMYSYSYLTEKGVEIAETGTLKSNARIKIDSLLQEDLSELPDFGFQIIYYRETSREWFLPIVKRFRVNPVKFYKEKSFQPNSFFRQNAMLLKIASDSINENLDAITDDEFKKLVKDKTSDEGRVKPLRKKTPDEVVVDLHVTELIDNAEGLSNREILEVQMEHVQSEMNAAIRDRVKRIVFIHGVGQGVLKQEVAKILQTKFKKYYFQDASFKEYGYGATMVILRKG